MALEKSTPKMYVNNRAKEPGVPWWTGKSANWWLVGL